MNLTTKRYQDREHPMRGIRLFLLFVVLFGSIETAQAQWSTPDSNGNIYYNGGNVGVNTSSPAARVHIEGDVLLGSYKAYISRYTTDNQYRGHTQWDHLQLGNNGANLIVAGNTASGGELGFVVNNTADLVGQYGIQTYNGTMAMYLKSNGNVGIGTTSPQSIFDIGKSQTAPAFRIGNSNYGTNYNSVWGLQSGAQSIMIFGNNGQNEIRAGNSNGGGYLDFFTNNTADYTSPTNGNFVMRLANNGNLGIGTTGPLTKLHTKGSGFFESPSLNGINIVPGASLQTIQSDWNSGGGDTPILIKTQNGGNQVYLATSGNVGIGAAPGSYKLDVNGTAHISGNVTIDGNLAAKYQDVAEWVPSSEQLAAGTVVVLDSTKSNQVTSSTTAYDTRVAGVISERPGIALGEKGDSKVLVATTGRVRVKVDGSKGAIHIGDLLVTSDIPGVAMKSEPVNLGGVQIHRPGTLIGKALEPFEKGTGTILVLLSLQ
jgi:hypothetical protein